VGAQPRRRCLPRCCLACVPPGGHRSPRSRYSRPRMGRSTPSVAAEAGAGWLPPRVAGPIVVVASPVVVLVADPVVVGSELVVVASVVVGCTVVVGALVVGCTVVVGAVTVGWVVVVPSVDGAWVVVVLPAVAGGVVVVGPLRSDGTVSAVVVDGAGGVVGSREAVLVGADVGARWIGGVGSAAPGARRGGG
jgi:hypothetical protein